MSERTTLQRLRDANPVPDPAELREASPAPTALLYAIDERARTMSTQQAPTKTPHTPPPPRFPIAVTAVAAIVVVVGLLIWTGGGDQEVATTPPVPTTTPEAVEPSPLPQVEAWVVAMNRGDLDEALSLLSPEASCDLPMGSVDTCEDHLGYLIAIETAIETRSCSDAAPYRCSFGLTSGLHAAMGYPDYSLPMSPEVRLDDNGLIVADFFGGIDTSTPYWPTEGGDLWAWMVGDYPELNIGLPFGPDPYTAEAGRAAMEAAREFNDPERVVQQLSVAIDRNYFSGVRSCETSFGMVDCRSLSEFLGDINAEVVLECDPESASEGVISCNSSFTSDIHRALGSEASSVPVSVEYRGGKAQAISVVLSFAADPTLHEEFMGFATTVDGLIRENGRPIWNADSGGDWVAAAEAFANR